MGGSAWRDRRSCGGFGLDGNEHAEIAGVVTSTVSVISYIFAEGSVDAVRVKADASEVQGSMDTE